jgi:hypothetical protein
VLAAGGQAAVPEQHGLRHTCHQLLGLHDARDAFVINPAALGSGDKATAVCCNSYNWSDQLTFQKSCKLAVNAQAVLTSVSVCEPNTVGFRAGLPGYRFMLNNWQLVRPNVYNCHRPTTPSLPQRGAQLAGQAHLC